MQFEGKTVLVTGGASGIGEGIVEAFAKEGAQVALTYRTSDPSRVLAMIGRCGRQALAIKADLRDEAAVDEVFAKVIATFGVLDILVANTGGMVGRSAAVDMPLALWREVMDVNVTSTFLCCRAALRHMQPRQAGSIILISSMAGHNGGGPNGTHYGAAKGTLIAYTRGLAKEVGPAGIRVNGIAPGLIATRFQDIFNTPERRKSAVNNTPLRREGTPEDVASAALYLAGTSASFITGETIEVNGGQVMY